MDPITTAIVVAVGAGAASGLSETVKTAVADGYAALKNAIISRIGNDNDVAEAIVKVEQNPQSTNRQGTLAEEIANAGIDKDEELLRLAQAITAALPPQPSGSNQFNNYASNQGAQGTFNAPVNFGDPKK